MSYFYTHKTLQGVGLAGKDNLANRVTSPVQRGEYMNKTKMMLLGALLTVAGTVFAAQPATPKGLDAYEVKEFHSDSRKFVIGDIVPDMYRTEEYNIKKWQLRNLPAPEAGSHWTYMGGNYVLITDAEGKILKAMNGDIFYHH